MVLMDDDTLPVGQMLMLSIAALVGPIIYSTCMDSTSDFVEGAFNTQCLSNLTRYKTSSSFSDADLLLEW